MCNVRFEGIEPWSDDEKVQHQQVQATFGTKIDRVQATMEFQPDGGQNNDKDATQFVYYCVINHANVWNKDECWWCVD